MRRRATIYYAKPDGREGLNTLFREIHVPEHAAEAIEQLGTKRKFWYTDPELGLALCKLVVRPNTGEDWAEKIAAELAALLGLPHAEYELGTWKGGRCVVSRNFVPPHDTLVHGNELLGEFDASYDASVSRFHQSTHTLEAVWKTLEQVGPGLPLGWKQPEGISDARDVFLGYLLLDALIGNTDRHHENWGTIHILSSDGTTRTHLAPTYDHASCLGCHELDDRRQAKLTASDVMSGVGAYAGRARSALYVRKDDRRAMLTVDAFLAAAERNPQVAEMWLRHLERINEASIDGLFARVPPVRISAISIDFARRILMHNQKRLLDWRAV